jgi:transposase
MKNTTIAVDLAKSVFQIAVSHHPGRVSEEHRLSRPKFRRFMAEQQPALVLLEACGTAHYWGREIRGLGHSVVLLPPHDVHRYVRRNKTDRADAKALLEAYRNEQLTPVPVKSVEQQALASLHRLRSAWIGHRTARINTVRGILREFGIFIPQGAARVVASVHELLGETESPVPHVIRAALAEACEDIKGFEQKIRSVECQLAALAREMPVVQQLRTIPGIGLITATTLVALVGDIRRFRTGRRFASFLGITPKENSTGLRRRLGAINKKGDAYLRMLLIHGGRSVLRAAKLHKEPDRLRAWALEVERRRGHNKAAVAVANKLARIVWAVWKEERPFESIPDVA